MIQTPDRPKTALNFHHRVGVLLLHGFSGCPGNLASLEQALTDVGLAVENPLLPGHGTTWPDLERVTGGDWIRATEAAFLRLKERTEAQFVCGLSMGGLLALNLGADHPEIRGLILINHALFLPWHPALETLVPLARFFIPVVTSRPSDIKDPGAEGLTYDHLPLSALNQMIILQKHVRPRLGEVRAPVLIFKSREDHVIPALSAVHTHTYLASENNRLVWLENSYHVATQDFDKYRIAVETIRFIHDLVPELDS